jgi:hypothetical protein
MNRRIRLLTLLSLPLAASCFQKGPGPEGVAPPPVDAGDPKVQCAPNSSACYTLCFSPECGLADGGLPPVLQTPVILYQPGGSVNSVGDQTPAKTTTDPCVAINDAAQTIRKRSCAPCHTTGTTGGSLTKFDYVLDDMMLSNHPDSSGGTDGKVMVKPGDPQSSYIYQRVVSGLAGAGMPPAAQSTVSAYTDPNKLVYPSAADVTVLYAWISTCMPGANANLYQSNYGGGVHGPAAASHTDGGTTGN